MKIADILNVYDRSLEQIIRVYDMEDNMYLCESIIDMIGKMPRGEMRNWLDTEFMCFESSHGVALHFYCKRENIPAKSPLTSR